MGISGLDEVLLGGLPPSRSYLIRGGPGTGKTTVGLHFLASGLQVGDRVLFISFTEPEQNTKANASCLGMAVEGMPFLDLTAGTDVFAEMQTYDIFSPAEVEREPVTSEMRQCIEDLRPRRLFVDGFGQMRYLAGDGYHYRRLVQSFCRLVTGRGTTLLIAGDEEGSDQVLESAADGVIHLDRTYSERTLRVIKLRGSDFRAGAHPMRLTDSGVHVLPLPA